MISYLVSEPLNTTLMNTMKIKMHGKHQALRFFLASMIAAAFDSGLFSILAFYQQMDKVALFKFIVSMWLIKLLIETLFLPLGIYIVRCLYQD